MAVEPVTRKKYQPKPKTSPATGTAAGLKEIQGKVVVSEEYHETPPQVKVKIQLKADELDKAYTAIDERLSGYGRYFQRGGQLVVVLDVPAIDIVRGPLTQPTVRGLTVDGLRAALADKVTFTKFDKRLKDFKPCGLDRETAGAYLSEARKCGLPVLRGLITAPTIRPDGSILQRPGHDPETGLFLAGGKFSPVLDTPTREDAEKALTAILAPLAGFPFVDDPDKAAAVAAVLTVIARPCLSVVPMFAITARTMATGKTLLAWLIAFVGAGRNNWASASYTTDAEELAKSVLSLALAGETIQCFDNIDRPFKSGKLCDWITNPEIGGRILGQSKTSTIPNLVTFLATGNNLTLAGDLTTRALRIAMDAGVEHPEERAFEVDLRQWVPANRGRLVAAGLNILRAYHLAGKPKPQGWSEFGRFEAWSDLVRGAVVWLGMDDPLVTKDSLAELDPVTESLGEVLTAWHECFGNESKTAAEAIKQGSAQLQEAIDNAINSPQGVKPKTLGKWLKSYEGRIVDGLKISSKRYQGIKFWKVEG
ncbi:MAG: hypothetical protein LBP55_03595 [Candidatus Adiutrix sp.]|jgi:hypothetical protein|nr:hypothetical protein [Candidatus Adiutrix sp.]